MLPSSCQLNVYAGQLDDERITHFVTTAGLLTGGNRLSQTAQSTPSATSVCQDSEPPNPELECDASSGARYVGGKPQVEAVNPGRPGPALRSDGADLGAVRIDAHHAQP